MSVKSGQSRRGLVMDVVVLIAGLAFIVSVLALACGGLFLLIAWAGDSAYAWAEPLMDSPPFRAVESGGRAPALPVMWERMAPWGVLAVSVLAASSVVVWARSRWRKWSR